MKVVQLVMASTPIHLSRHGTCLIILSPRVFNRLSMAKTCTACVAKSMLKFTVVLVDLDMHPWYFDNDPLDQFILFREALNPALSQVDAVLTADIVCEFDVEEFITTSQSCR